MSDAAAPGPGIPPGSPFRAEHFRKPDASDDALFYSTARLVTHIDDQAIEALRGYYASVLESAAAVLDLMSSWISHYPSDLAASRVAGLGMNGEELAANPVLSERTVQDLNRDPILPYEDGDFDAVTIAVSVQYLQDPIRVFREIARVLQPDGLCLVSFSNRCFPTKAVSLWQGTHDAAHAQIVAAYFEHAGGFDEPEALDLSPSPRISDPLYVVQARRQTISP